MKSDADQIPEIEKKVEWALCYYKTDTSKEKNGWLFLADVKSVYQDKIEQWITVVHPSKTYKLRAPSHVEHKKWFDIISKYSKPKTNDLELVSTMILIRKETYEYFILITFI